MSTNKATARILIVEDDGIIAYSLQRMVQKLGYEVVGPVPSGRQAIQKASEKNPDLILMDINLAGKLNGIEVAAHIQARSKIPVVYLSGYTEDILLEAGEIGEPYAYLSKPVYEWELGDTLTDMLAERISKQT